MKINRRQCITYAFVIAAYIVLQILSGQKLLSSTARGMLVPICAYVVMAISLNLTVGVMGELSLGHAGFMSVGAFMGTTAAVSLQGVIASAPLRLAIAMVIGAIFAAIIGFLIGIPVLRLRGDYLAIVTLAFGEIIKSIFTNLYIGLDSRGYHIRFLQAPENLEEGGKLILGGPMGIGGVQKIATFTGGFILVMLCLIVIFHLVNSRTGRAILAIRDNRIAAESVGIPVTRYKMTAFVISASMAGAAGALFALNYSTIAANKFDFNASILILVFVVFGGLGNMLGSVIAAALLTLGVNAAVMALLYGFGKTRVTLVMNFCRVFLFRVPVLWALQQFTDLGNVSAGIVMAVSNVASGVLAAVVGVIEIRRICNTYDVRYFGGERKN